MPILAKSTGALMPGRGLINPAFVIKIVPATDDLQQQASSGRNNPNDDYLDNLKVGNEVKAKVKGKEIIGKVQRIIKNQLGDGVFVIVSDSRGKLHKIEGSRIEKTRGNNIDNDKERLASSPGLFNESKFLSFYQFSNES
jgi:hypothetical protein